MKQSLTLILLLSVAITAQAIVTKAAMMERMQDRAEVDEYEYNYHDHVATEGGAPSKSLSQLEASLTSGS